MMPAIVWIFWVAGWLSWPFLVILQYTSFWYWLPYSFGDMLLGGYGLVFYS